MDIYEYRIWEKRYWGGHITHWTPIFAINDSEALEVVKTRVDRDALIANADIPPSVAPLDQIRAFAAHGRLDAGVHVYDFCQNCSEPYSVRGTTPPVGSHQCAASDVC